MSCVTGRSLSIGVTIILTPILLGLIYYIFGSMVIDLIIAHPWLKIIILVIAGIISIISLLVVIRLWMSELRKENLNAN